MNIADLNYIESVEENGIVGGYRKFSTRIRVEDVQVNVNTQTAVAEVRNKNFFSKQVLSGNASASNYAILINKD